MCTYVNKERIRNVMVCLMEDIVKAQLVSIIVSLLIATHVLLILYLTHNIVNKSNEGLED